jgi:FRG domain-containing protein
MNAATIQTTEEFVRRIRNDRDGWSHAWFRGEPKVGTPLTPKLYRSRPDGLQHHENKLLQLFRMKAPTFSAHPCPDRGKTDQWLFLAQHVGLPTRLLDWTESALVALHFALLEEKQPVVWMLNPIELNRRSVSDNAELVGDEFPLTWFNPCGKRINIGSINIRAAWEYNAPGVDLPVAVQPTNIHPRMSVQRSCFTVQGKDKRSLALQAPELLRCYEIYPEVRSQLRENLRLLGISHSTVFPDLDGLAKELTELY